MVFVIYMFELSVEDIFLREKELNAIDSWSLTAQLLITTYSM